MTDNRPIAVSDIEKQLKRLQTGKKFAETLVWLGIITIVVPTIIFAALLDMADTAVVCVLLGMLLFIVGFTLKKAFDRRIKKHIGAHLVRAMLAEHMDYLEAYDPRGGVAPAAIKVGMGYPSYDRVEKQGDYIRGIFHCNSLETADFSLEEKEIYYLPESEDPHRPYERYNTVFHGRIILCHHRCNLATPVVVNRFTRLANESKTGDEAFDELFSVRAGTTSDIARVCTPQYRKALLELARQPGGDSLAIRYDPDNRLTIVLRNHDFFEVADADTDAATIKARFAEEMELIGRVLDVLDL